MKRPPRLSNDRSQEYGISGKTHCGMAIALLALIVVTLFYRPEGKPVITAPPAGRVQPVARSLRLGLNLAAGSALHAAALRFADQVAKRSGGQLQVTVHPDQQLGTDDQMLEMARNGALDLVLTPTAKLSAALPAMQYADLPFYFSGRDELYAMLDGEPGAMLLAKLNAIDLVGLAFWENGFKQFTANSPIHAPHDFAGLRIRTMKSRLIMEQFETLGARPISIDFHATYQALADGAVDGQENPLVAIAGMGFYQVQKHLTMSNHAYLGYAFSASKQVFATLPPEMRVIIQGSARELTFWEREETARREAQFLETIRAAGVTIHTLTPEERRQFSTRLAPLADKFGFEVGYDLLAKTEELRQAGQGAPVTLSDGEPLLLGLDADLSAGAAQAGGAIFRGMQLAVEEINRQGGLLGSPLRVIALDNAANPQSGRQNLEHFAAMPSLLAVFGGMYTAVIMEELEDIHRLQIPYLIPWAGGHGLTAHKHRPSYTFRVSISDTQAVPFLLDHALTEGGPVAVLLEQSAWGRSNEAVLTPLIEQLPAGSATITWLYAGDSDIEAKLKVLAAGGVRSLLIMTSPAVSRSIVQAMARLERPLPIFAHWGVTGCDFWGHEQAALQRVDLRFLQTVLLEGAENTDRRQQFLDDYRLRYGLAPDDPIPAPAGSAQAYDLVHLLAQAVTQARSTDREAVRAALENLPPYSGVVRDYNPPFTRERHEALTGSPLSLGRFDARGHIVAED